jgi:hypothetical protein
MMLIRATGISNRKFISVVYAEFGVHLVIHELLIDQFQQVF